MALPSLRRRCTLTMTSVTHKLRYAAMFLNTSMMLLRFDSARPVRSRHTAYFATSNKHRTQHSASPHATFRSRCRMYVVHSSMQAWHGSGIITTPPLRLDAYLSPMQVKYGTYSSIIRYMTPCMDYAIFSSPPF